MDRRAKQEQFPSVEFVQEDPTPLPPRCPEEEVGRERRREQSDPRSRR
jgi:hypothetical protein